MPFHNLHAAGAFAPEEVDLLSRVLRQVVKSTDTNGERADQAIEIMTLYRSGITDEPSLVSVAAMKRILLEL